MTQFTSVHGESHSRRTPEYRVWSNMRDRCLNPRHPNYKHYGGRGVRICPAWASYGCFLADMGRRPSAHHSLDRVNNDGDYTPANCRWALKSEQQRNKRGAILLTFQGETLPLAAWAERLGIAYETLRQRLKRGWSISEVLAPLSA